jgi:hypothetical protein
VRTERSPLLVGIAVVGIEHLTANALEIDSRHAGSCLGKRSE